MQFGKHTLGAAALAAMNAAGSLAASEPFCVGPDSNLCFRWGVPEDAAQSGSGSVYFQMRAPASYTWLGLGIGDAMRGAEIFLMYANGDGNVTVSPRQGTGHVMPQYSERSFDLLAGSGIENDTMVANVRCNDCSSLELGGTNSWISAWQEGEPLNSDDLEERITRHDAHRQFQIDFAQAQISSDTNPFLDGNAEGGGVSTGGGSNSGGGGGPLVGNEGGGGNSSSMLIWAHGIIMMLVFVVMYPIGAILMPLVGKWFIHAGWQTIAFLAMWAGLGLGYTIAHRNDIFFKQTHTRLGIIVVALMGLQPALGLIHHFVFRQHKLRPVSSFVHVWYGRALIILGIINGGLGLKLADGSQAFLIAYIVIAAVFGGLYLASVPFTEYRKAKAARREKSISSPATAQDSS